MGIREKVTSGRLSDPELADRIDRAGWRGFRVGLAVGMLLAIAAIRYLPGVATLLGW